MSRYAINLNNRIYNENIEFENGDLPIIHSVCITDGHEITDVFEFATEEDARRFIYVNDLELEDETCDMGIRWGYLVSGEDLSERDFEYEDKIYYVSEVKEDEETPKMQREFYARMRAVGK